MGRLIWHKVGMLIPALAWLVVQFSMSGIMAAKPAEAMQIEICSAYGVQQIAADPATGQPPQSGAESGCDWCHHFGATIDPGTREALDWVAVARDFRRPMPTAPVHMPRHTVAGFDSRAPPRL